MTEDSGFTLLELLVVVAVLGLLLVALTNGVQFAGRAWQMEQQRTVRNGDLDAVHNVLRQLVTSGYAFQGDGKELKFIAQAPAALHRGGLYDVTLRAPEGALLLTFRPHFKGPSANQETTETVLARGVTAFSLQYYSGGGWKPAIQDQTESLALIKIELNVADGRPFSPLVVASPIELQQPGATN